MNYLRLYDVPAEPMLGVLELDPEPLLRVFANDVSRFLQKMVRSVGIQKITNTPRYLTCKLVPTSSLRKRYCSATTCTKKILSL